LEKKKWERSADQAGKYSGTVLAGCNIVPSVIYASSAYAHNNDGVRLGSFDVGVVMRGNFGKLKMAGEFVVEGGGLIYFGLGGADWIRWRCSMRYSTWTLLAESPASRIH
jgi:hypothetical protein